MTSVWTAPPGSTNVSGAGAIEVVGDSVYLGAMGSGFMIFDVADRRSPRLLSRTQPSIDFPGDRNPNPDDFNFRVRTTKATTT